MFVAFGCRFVLRALTTPPKFSTPSFLRKLFMIFRIAVVIPVYMAVATAGSGEDTAFSLLEAGGWCFRRIYHQCQYLHSVRCFSSLRNEDFGRRGLSLDEVEGGKYGG